MNQKERKIEKAKKQDGIFIYLVGKDISAMTSKNMVKTAIETSLMFSVKAIEKEIKSCEEEYKSFSSHSLHLVLRKKVEILTMAKFNTIFGGPYMGYPEKQYEYFERI